MSTEIQKKQLSYELPHFSSTFHSTSAQPVQHAMTVIARNYFTKWDLNPYYPSNANLAGWEVGQAVTPLCGGMRAQSIPIGISSCYPKLVWRNSQLLSWLIWMTPAISIFQNDFCLVKWCRHSLGNSTRTLYLSYFLLAAERRLYVLQTIFKAGLQSCTGCEFCSFPPISLSYRMKQQSDSL